MLSSAGLAYIRVCDGAASAALHLLRGGSDTVLAVSAGALARTTDRTRLAYRFHDASETCAACNAIGVIDVVGGSHDTIPTGESLGYGHGEFFSPDGESILSATADGRYLIFDLEGGAPKELPQNGGDGSTRALGWDNRGIWFRNEIPGTISIYNPADGSTLEFPSGLDPNGNSRTLNGGTLLPGERGAVLWTWRCASNDRGSGYCIQEELAIWRWNPPAPAEELVLPAYDPLGMPPGYRDYGFFGIASPDGRRLAYSIGDEIRVLPVP